MSRIGGIWFSLFARRLAKEFHFHEAQSTNYAMNLDERAYMSVR
jgi:hypothetical protein